MVEQKGEKFIICRNGKQVAELGPYKRKSRLEYDPLLSQIEIKYDPTEDLAEDEWGNRKNVAGYMRFNLVGP